MSTNSASENGQQTNGGTRREQLKAGLSTIGNALQRINLVKLINDMEQDQELADHLESFNKETNEEAERKQLVQESLAKCKAEMEDHLSTFLLFHPNGSYEDWIQDLHPENVAEGNLLPGLKDVDLRFYVADSDHRLLWNERVPDRQVPARTYKLAQGEETAVDLLSDDLLSDVCLEEQPISTPTEKPAQAKVVEHPPPPPPPPPPQVLDLLSG